MLTRNVQLAAKKEDTQGVAENLAAADAKFLVKDPKYKADFEKNERDISRRNLSKIQDITGKKTASLSFGLELRGSGTATSSPAWEKLLQACGFTKNSLKTLTVGAISSGPFLHGETITQSTTSATGRVVIKTVNGTTTLYFVDLGGGTWDGTNDITGGTSGATATPTAIADAGLEYKPFSTELSEVSIGAISSGPFTAGEIVTGGTSAATGYVYAETATGASVLKYRVISGAFQSGESITGGTSGASATTSSVATQSELPTLSFGLYNDGFKEGMKGARGQVKFDLEVGKPGIMDFEFNGVFVDADDVAELTGITHESTTPPVWLDANFSVNGYAALLSKVGIDCNNTVAARESANDENGILSYRITGREMSGSIDPEMVLKARQDFYSQWKDNTEVPVDFTLGDTAGNMFRVYIPRAQLNDLDNGDREGIRTADISLALNGSMDPGDDELTILHI